MLVLEVNNWFADYVSELNRFHQLHHLEEVGLGVGEVVHHAVFAMLAQGGKGQPSRVALLTDVLQLRIIQQEPLRVLPLLRVPLRQPEPR